MPSRMGLAVSAVAKNQAQQSGDRGPGGPVKLRPRRPRGILIARRGRAFQRGRVSRTVPLLPGCTLAVVLFS